MRLVLVRHGQSAWNLERRLQGQTMDVSLTPLGHQQALAAARVVAALVPRGTSVWTSDQLRACQTAAPVAEALGTTPWPTVLLREQALGELEGRLVDDLVAEPVPEGLDISEVRWGGGESVADVHARCRRLLDELALLGADDVVLVGHGDTLRILLAAVAGRGHRDVEWRELGNGEVVEAHWQPAAR